MGNTATSSPKEDKCDEEPQNETLPNRLNKSIPRIICHAPDDEDPDVETLRIPFDVARNIFLNLSFSDIFNCMLVCKEWRSLIDTCSFWDDYLHTNFDFDVKDVSRTSPLYEWKYGASRKAPFKPFPDMWGCGVVVPHGMLPVQGYLAIYHSFISAMIWIQQLQNKLQETPVSHPMDTCLIPWYNEWMPTESEFMSILGGDPNLLNGVPEAKPLSRQEMKNYLSIMNGRYSSSQFDAILYRWIADKVFDKVILFECNPLVVKPAPSFIVTRLAPGWVGGIIYSR